MIVVTVELRPGGDPLRAKTLERVEIVNDGSGGFEVGSYDVATSDGRTARVESFTRSEGVLKLVARAIAALEDVGADEVPPAANS